MENKFLDAMNFRHACKEFDPSKRISEEDFNTILEIGKLSPSSFGLEPWKFLVIQNLELREKLKGFTWGAQGTLPTASHFVILLARKRKEMVHDSAYVDHIMDNIKKLPQDIKKTYKGFYKKFQKEDFKLLESDRAFFDWASKQTYIAMGNMMTGAAYLGIDSCPIEGFDRDKTVAFLEKDLNIDTEKFDASVMVAFGFRKESPQREKVRQELSDITQWYN